MGLVPDPFDMLQKLALCQKRNHLLRGQQDNIRVLNMLNLQLSAIKRSLMPSKQTLLQNLAGNAIVHGGIAIDQRVSIGS
ncbi:MULTISPECIES: hypothetical protein [Paenibacillus]|uniref:Uncharacterized protein n=1 Tax=Paenibacillus polymyxa TaxID=1406 RepID=A0AAP3ZZN0_PAEPO|nr:MULTISPECIES: hypothetical protein [Paenibacillus]MDH2332647.1 hypothetical protein [Paenibacillus polymyxa]